MKIKSLFFAFALSLMLLGGLSGCVASGGYGSVGYGYYPPRPVVVVPRPYYRPAPYYRPNYRSYYEGGYRDGGYRGGNYGGGGYHGRRGR